MKTTWGIVLCTVLLAGGAAGCDDSADATDAGGGGTKVLVRLPSIISVKVDGDKNNINTSVFGGKTNSSNVFLYIVFGIFVIILSLYFFKKWLR